MDLSGFARFARFARIRARRLVLALLGAILVLGQVVVPVDLTPARADGGDASRSNVVAIPAAVDVDGNGALDDIVTLVAPEGTTLTNVRALAVPGDNPPPAGVRLPYGLFEYDVEVANPGDSAEVTYVLPDGAAPTSVHMFQNGVWSDYAQYTSIDSVTGDVTVALRDGGEGDENRKADGVISDPSGPSTSNQTITVTNASGASAPNMTYRLERCSETSGTNCTGATAVGTASGSNNASGDSAALGNGSSWYWGSATALDYGRNYRLSVITALPASNWSLSGRACNPDGDTASNSGATAIVVRLANTGNNRRATCTFTYETTGGTITARKGGLRNTGSNDTGSFASGLQGATFEYSPNSNFSAPLNNLCVTPAATDATGACVSDTVGNGNYHVREKAAPAGWNTIPQIAYGGDAFSQSPLVNYTQQVGINNSNATTRRFVNRMTNPALTSSCGLNVSMVLDRSGSITPNSATYATAAKGFVDALANTPSQMKIFSFAASASADQNTFVSLSTGAGVTSLKNTIDSVYNSTGGGTNWDAGLQQAISSGSNLVLFITDGNPTARNGDTGSTGTVNLEDVEYGIASANSVKSANQTIWAVGVANQGSGGITPTNLELVSGPGDFYTADLNTISATLEDLANQLCGSRIHVRKLVGGVPQTGWSFSAAGGGAGVTFGGNPVVTAGAAGEGVITVDGIPGNGTSAVTVTESLAGKTGYSFDKAACQLNSYPAANTGTANNPQSIAKIDRNQDWYCTFNNVAAPTLTLTKTADASPIDAGESMGFTITASSTGVGTALGATLSDPLPTGAGVSWSIDPAVAGCSITTNTLQCSFGDMASGTSKSVHVTSATAFASCKTYENSATLDATNHAPVQASASVVVLCPALEITKTADAASVSAGDPIGFTITVKNTGAGAAGVLVLSDPLPTGPGISWSINPPEPGCSITAGTLTCFSGSLLPGASDSVHVTSPTTAASCQVYPNTATLTAINHSPVQASATTTVNCPNLEITKTADASPITAGDAMGFTIGVSNTGAGVAKSVTLADALPTGAGVSWAIDPAVAGCSIGANTLTCNYGDMASGATKTVHITSATTIATPCTIYANTANAQATNHAQVEASAAVNVQCPALQVTKTADNATVDAGDAIGFTVTVTNTGAGVAKAATLTDPLPGGNGINWSIDPAYAGPGTCGVSGSAPNQNLNCAFGDLASGASVTVHVTSNTERASCATYNNTAFAAATNATGAQASASTSVACPNLAVTKTADASTVSAGSDIGFTITVSNPGPGTAKAVGLTDALPGGAGITWSISPATAGCSITGSTPSQTLNCSFGDMAAGASKAVHVVSPTTGATPCAAYPNTASAQATNNPQVQASATTSVQCPGLQITKTADDTTVNAGESIGFTITVNNTGAGTATGVTLDDPLPTGAGVNWSISPAKAGCSIVANTLSCSFGDMASGASHSVHVTSATTFASCKTYANTATADATNSAEVQASASTTVQCPDVALTKAADASTVSAGDPIGFTITATNSGAGVAKSVTLSDPLPTGSGITWSISPAVPGCSIAANTLDCNFGDMASGASKSVHVSSPTTPASCQAYPNTATLNATNHPQVQASATTTVTCPLLAITKTADAASVDAGSAIGFTITVGNTGAGVARSVTLSDPLPGGNGVDWSISPAYTGAGTCSIAGAAPNQTLNCTFGDMASGASNSVHVTSATTFASCKAYANEATASTTNGDSKTADATTTVNCADLDITKTADGASVSAGSPIGFTIAVSNAGGGTAKGITINDPLPTGTGIVWSISPAVAGCSIADNTLTCDFGDLGPEGSASVHVTSPTTSASCKEYPNTASLTATNHPALEASATTTVLCPSLSITKIADEPVVNTGDDIGFTIEVSNAGPGVAQAVTVNDPLPAGDGVAWSIDPAYAGPGTCSITGSAPEQVLECAFGDLAAQGSVSVHVKSATTKDSAGNYENTATASADNHDDVEDTDDVTVRPPALSIVKTADEAEVDAGNDIGFTITVSNSDAEGTGIARSVTIDDPLPAGAGSDWSIDPAYAGPGTCTINGAAPAQTLTCAVGDMAPGDTTSVHIVSPTAADIAESFDNTATASTTNGDSVEDDDSINTIVISPQSSTSSTTTPTTVTTTTTPGGPVSTQAPPPGPLPFTGSSTFRLLAMALVLLAAGAALALGRRRQGHVTR